MVGPFATGSEASDAVQQPQGCRRPVHHPEELARLSLTLARGRGLIRADGGTRIHHRIGGLTISANERAFLREAQPWGLIIFKRNVSTPAASV